MVFLCVRLHVEVSRAESDLCGRRHLSESNEGSEIISAGRKHLLCVFFFFYLAQLYFESLYVKTVNMVAKQRIRMANEKHSKNITQRGNVAKSSVS